MMHNRLAILFLSASLITACTSIDDSNDLNDANLSSQSTDEQKSIVQIDSSNKTSSDTVKTATDKVTSEKKTKAADAVALAAQQDWQWPTESEEALKPHTTSDNLDLTRPLIQSFIDKLVTQHNFEREYLIQALRSANNKPRILEIMSRPAEKSKEWYEYREIFLTPKRIERGQQFLSEHYTALSAAEKKYGVPKEIITAIIGVETHYGRITGKYKVIDALVTLGFNYPPRAQFFRRELEQFFLLSREEGFDPLSVLGSYAGAMGNAQFISSSYRNFTADGDGDGKRDLWNSWPDAIHSVANYFYLHDWQKEQPVFALAKSLNECSQLDSVNIPESKVSLETFTIQSIKQHPCQFNFEADQDYASPAMYINMKYADYAEHLIGFSNFYTITRYNRSPKYARAVYELSQAYNANQ